MNNVIDVLMGWDTKLQCPTLGGGLFGFCKGFFASTKSQGDGNLHTHWLVYTHGMPTTTTRFKKLVRDTNRLIAHQTTLLQMEMFISKGIICPECDGPLHVLVLLVFTFKRAERNASALLQQIAQHVKLVSLVNIY
jgi:hypothetical protein